MPPFPDHPSQEPAGGLVTEESADPILEGFSRPRRVLVTGGTGFIGRHLVRRLVSRGHTARVLSRDPLGRSALLGPGVELRGGDVLDAASLQGAAAECDVVVHLVAPVADRVRRHPVYSAGTRNLLREAEAAGVRRFVYVSALGAGPHGDHYLRSKFYAEGEILRSEVEHVFLRPASVYGPGDHFTSVLRRILRLPVFPMPGRGSFLTQPVAIEDLADALTQGVERSDLANHSYEIAGPEPMSFADVVRIVARVTGLRRPVLHLPGRLYSSLLSAAEVLHLPAPLTAQELAYFRRGGVLTGPENALRSVFRIEPLPFRDAVADYL